jgi:hypothetical protein
MAATSPAIMPTSRSSPGGDPIGRAVDRGSEPGARLIGVAARVRSVTMCSPQVPSSGVEHRQPDGCVARAWVMRSRHIWLDGSQPSPRSPRRRMADRGRRSGWPSTIGSVCGRGVGRDPATREPCHAADQIGPPVVLFGGKPLVTDGAPSGTRTPNPLIKREQTSTSSALYQHLWQHRSPLEACEPQELPPVHATNHATRAPAPIPRKSARHRNLEDHLRSGQHRRGTAERSLGEGWAPGVPASWRHDRWNAGVRAVAGHGVDPSA